MLKAKGVPRGSSTAPGREPLWILKRPPNSIHWYGSNT